MLASHAVLNSVQDCGPNLLGLSNLSIVSYDCNNVTIFSVSFNPIVNVNAGLIVVTLADDESNPMRTKEGKFNLSTFVPCPLKKGTHFTKKYALSTITAESSIFYVRAVISSYEGEIYSCAALNVSIKNMLTSSNGETCSHSANFPVMESKISKRRLSNKAFPLELEVSSYKGESLDVLNSSQTSSTSPTLKPIIPNGAWAWGTETLPPSLAPSPPYLSPSSGNLTTIGSSNPTAAELSEPPSCQYPSSETLQPTSVEPSEAPSYLSTPSGNLTTIGSSKPTAAEQSEPPSCQYPSSETLQPTSVEPSEAPSYLSTPSGNLTTIGSSKPTAAEQSEPPSCQYPSSETLQPTSVEPSEAPSYLSTPSGNSTTIGSEVPSLSPTVGPSLNRAWAWSSESLSPTRSNSELSVDRNKSPMQSETAPNGAQPTATTGAPFENASSPKKKDKPCPVGGPSSKMKPQPKDEPTIPQDTAGPESAQPIAVAPPHDVSPGPMMKMTPKGKPCPAGDH